MTTRTNTISDDLWSLFGEDRSDGPVPNPYPMKVSIDPLVALIDGLGITSNNTLDPCNFHRFDGDLFNNSKDEAISDVQKFISLIEVNPTTVDLVADIKDYYRTAMGIARLQGIGLTPWRERMLQVLNNCDRMVIQERDDLSLLFKLYEFYYEDMEIDMLTHDAKNAEREITDSRLVDMPELRTFENVVPLRVTAGKTKAAKRINSYYLYGRTTENTVVRIVLRGSPCSQSLAELIVKHQIPFTVEGDTIINLANGSQVCYYNLLRAKITEGTI